MRDTAIVYRLEQAIGCVSVHLYAMFDACHSSISSILKNFAALEFFNDTFPEYYEIIFIDAALTTILSADYKTS